jgi:hypothetical protein
MVTVWVPVSPLSVNEPVRVVEVPSLTGFGDALTPDITGGALTLPTTTVLVPVAEPPSLSVTVMLTV